MVMYDTEFKSKGNEIYTKDEIWTTTLKLKLHDQN